MALLPITKVGMLLGRCVPCVKQNTSKFKVRRLELDTNLNMHFPKDEFIYAHDPKKLCKSGDVVLIEQLPERMTRLITHSVKKVVYPMGDITDPITGKKVVVGKYRENIDKINRVYGERPDTFKYDKAPPRGWQEGKKDFTDRDTYIKFDDTLKDDPYAI